MDWKKYKKERFEMLSTIREHLGKALKLIEETEYVDSHYTNLRFNVAKAKGDIEYEMYEVTRTGDDDESIYKHFTWQRGIPIDGFEYVDAHNAVRVRCRFPDGLRTFYMDSPMYQINIITIREYLDGIQDEEDQDQIME